MTQPPIKISAYHAHVYFNADSLDQAVEFCEQTRDTQGITMGRVHQKLVGPHPGWSCQLSFGSEKIAAILPWLILNRNGLSVFIHPVTGNDLDDHTQYVMWLGDSKPLNLELFL
ncbi:DOPA 4,5-dioxygenase family protein [Amphritea sp.]|uniref:DOPA 4,5-dioxygenase family protein n=1 Tax=Amphritea sp. TaxID=1872502 RepID=UPI0025BCD259|nr:DOPA 4,5-dioxygenase family protein [Amphritea sp.]